MPIDIESNLKRTRGYFDMAEYLDGYLVAGGWVLVLDKRIDKILLFIDRQFMCEYDIVENEDVEKADIATTKEGRTRKLLARYLKLGN